MPDEYAPDEQPWRCNCPLSLVGQHKDSCLRERLARVERLLIAHMTTPPPTDEERAESAPEQESAK